jgi:hypothetical protein
MAPRLVSQTLSDETNNNQVATTAFVHNLINNLIGEGNKEDIIAKNIAYNDSLTAHIKGADVQTALESTNTKIHNIIYNDAVYTHFWNLFHKVDKNIEISKAFQFLYNTYVAGPAPFLSIDTEKEYYKMLQVTGVDTYFWDETEKNLKSCQRGCLFYVSKISENNSIASDIGILSLRLFPGVEENNQKVRLEWLYASQSIPLENFFITYNNTNNVFKFSFYIKCNLNKERWGISLLSSIVFAGQDETWTLYNPGAEHSQMGKKIEDVEDNNNIIYSCIANTHPNTSIVTATSNGLMSASDKQKLDSLSLTDDTTGKKYTLGINNGTLYIKEII